jgi:hypothetical protein
LVTPCDYDKFVPVNRELAETDKARPGGLSVADELIKLTELREHGVLTQTEFDAQKAKLLGK